MKLAEIAEITTGFPFDGHKYTNKGIRVVRGENIGKETIHWEQKRIGKLLRSLDRKIELNHAINQNLPTLDHSSEAGEVRLAA